MYYEWADSTISQVFDHACDRHATRQAVLSDGQRLTFAQWRRKSLEIAEGLRQLGVVKGAPVACIIDNSPEAVTLFMALHRLGAPIVPLNLGWVGRELVQSMTLTDVEYIVTLERFRGSNFVDMLCDTLPELRAAKRDGLSVQALPHLKKVVVLSREGNTFDFAYDFDEIVVSGSGYVAEDLLKISRELSPDDPCLFLPTSGSTGFPKPVVHSHASFLNNCANYADVIEIDSSDCLLNYGVTYHVSGQVLSFVPAMRGASQYLMRWFDAEEALRVIESEGVTTTWGFAVHFLAMARHPRFRMYDISSLERPVIGSDPSAFEEIWAMGLHFHGNVYGCSEYLTNYLPWRDRHDVDHMRTSHGRPVAGVEQKIVDPATNERLGARELGEICVKGPGLFTGYYNMEELTAEAFDDEGYFHTGDYGFVDEDGYTYYRGRLKDTVKTGGENVSAREVELFLETETPWIATAQVFGVPDPKWGEAVTALVQVKAGASVTEDEIRENCRGRLAPYKIPKRVIFVSGDDWIVTPTGKFDKTALRARTLEGLGLTEA